MGWILEKNTAQYKGADWSNFIHKEPNCTPAKARRIAVMKPEVTFYFFCREYMVLEGPVYDKYGAFNPGDAVFFKGEPWLGSAPQCDTYKKNGLAVVYISPKNSEQFRQIGCFTMADGSPAIDVVCIFAANYCTDEVPCLRANNNNPPTQEPFNKNIQQVLSDGSVKFLQDKGIVVLLSIMNGHSSVGWSEFTAPTTAQNFANYLNSDVVSKYGLDGIDIDDEYSAGISQLDSLAMVTTLMKQTMPDKLVTKALWSDSYYFSANWEGHTLAQKLDYGWEMSYYLGGPNSRLSPYVQAGMNKKSLCLGFSAEDQFSEDWPTTGPTMQEVMKDGYGGGMLFDFENQPDSLPIMQTIVNTMAGPNNWNYNPNCG